jgi:hypothetical protein
MEAVAQYAGGGENCWSLSRTRRAFTLSLKPLTPQPSTLNPKL